MGLLEFRPMQTTTVLLKTYRNVENFLLTSDKHEIGADEQQALTFQLLLAIQNFFRTL